MNTSALWLTPNFIQQRLGLLEVLVVEPFSEPLGDRREKLICLVALVLALPTAQGDKRKNRISV